MFFLHRIQIVPLFYTNTSREMEVWPVLATSMVWDFVVNFCRSPLSVVRMMMLL